MAGPPTHVHAAAAVQTDSHAPHHLVVGSHLRDLHLQLLNCGGSRGGWACFVSSSLDHQRDCAPLFAATTTAATATGSSILTFSINSPSRTASFRTGNASASAGFMERSDCSAASALANIASLPAAAWGLSLRAAAPPKKLPHIAIRVGVEAFRAGGEAWVLGRVVAGLAFDAEISQERFIGYVD